LPTPLKSKKLLTFSIEEREKAYSFFQIIWFCVRVYILHREFAFPHEYDIYLNQEEFVLEFKIRYVLSTAPLVWRGAHFSGHTAFGQEGEQLIS
jgi:hypothetical protein